MRKLTKEKAIPLLLVASFASFNYCYGIKLNLTKSCSASQARSCVLHDIRMSFDNPFLVVNSTQSELYELLVRDIVLMRFPREILEHAPNLHTFIMYNCQLNRISPYDFEHASQLHTLILQRNRLSEIPERVFTGLPSLMELRLGQNNIHMVHQSAFVGLEQLKHLDLQQNAIHSIDRLFTPLVDLEYLDLSGNEISKIDSSTFAVNTKLTTLLLNNNKFIVFEPNSLEHLMHLHLLDVSNGFVEELNVQSVDTLYAQNSSLKRCNIGGSVIKFHASNNELKELNIADKASVRDLELHRNLFESLDNFTEMVNLQHLDLSKNHISSFVSIHPPLLLSLPSLNYLNLAFNKLRTFAKENFLILPKLTHLDIAFNNLIHFDADLFEPLNKLEKLYIDGNLLHVFDYKKFFEAHPLMKEVGLNANPWDPHHVREMINFLEQHSVHLAHYYPINMHEMLPKMSSPAGLQQRSKISAATSASEHPDVCQCSSSHGDVVSLITFILVFLIFVLQVFRWLQEKNFDSFCRRRSIWRLGQQWHSEPLDETVSEV